MKLQMFSVYDQKARTFCTPFFCPNEHVAVRAFGHSANDPTTEVGRYPHDFSIYHLGTFDMETGDTLLLDCPLHLHLAQSLVNQEQTENV